MPRVRIVHWRAEEAGPLIEACRAGGLEVDYEDINYAALAKTIRTTQPAALVIDLTRAPSHGRDVAVAIRRTKSTRHIPIVFVDGEAERVKAIRQLLPDAVYTSRARVASRVRAISGKTVANPVIPPAVMDRYKTRTVAQKLGISQASAAGLFDAPRDYMAVLGDLPEGVELVEDPERVLPVTIWFVRDPETYQSTLPRMRSIADRTKLWIAWRKGSANGTTQYLVRHLANEFGLVDYKIAALGAGWSAMAFARRKVQTKS